MWIINEPNEELPLYVFQTIKINLEQIAIYRDDIIYKQEITKGTHDRLLRYLQIR